MRRFVFLPLLALVAGCASGPARQPGESQVACIHRLYDLPARIEPFPIALSECAAGGRADLTGDPYFQTLATRYNLDWTSRDPKRDGSITLTGSRAPQPTTQPPSPELSFH